MKLGPGDVIGGRYVIERELGAGGMGVVWRARDRRLDRDVAVKVMLARSSGQADAALRFEREARVGAQLNHPHVIGTYDFGQIEDTVYLVLQLLPEGDLRAYAARRHPVPIQDACRIGYQIADALTAAHAAGVIHRDLKPENVLLQAIEPLHVRVADFGMAFLQVPIDPKDGRLTRDGRLSGTPASMPPEQILDQEIGAPADVYALGCLMFDLLAGAPVFEGGVAALIAQHVYTPAPRLAAVRPDTPSGLDELVDRMLEKEPARRPPAEAVRLRFAHLLDGNGDGAHAPALRGADPLDRDHRMISQQAEPIPFEPPAAVAGIRVGVVGTLATELATALGAAGLAIGGDAAVWLAIGRSTEEIAALVATRVPVLVTGRRDDFARVSEWLRLGVADVVFEPIEPAALVRKLQKALAGGVTQRGPR